MKMLNTTDTKIEALQTVVNGILLAQEKGAYTLEESAKLYEAIKQFTVKKKEDKEEQKEESPLRGS